MTIELFTQYNQGEEARVVQLTTAQIANPTASIIADRTADYIGPDGSRYYSNGAALYKLPKVLSSSRQSEFERQLSINGVVGNGTTDDTAAFQAALDACVGVSNNNGGRLLLPDVTFGLRSTLNIPTRIVLVGSGRRAINPNFSALSGFSGSFMIKIGRATGTDPLVFDAGLEDLQLNANGIASLGCITANKMQEGCRLQGLGIYGWTTRGISLPLDNNANFWLSDLEIYSDNAAAAEYGIYTKGSSDCIIDNTTVVGGSVGSLTAGVFIDTAASITMRKLHCERTTTALDIQGNDCLVDACQVSGSSGVTNVVRFSADRVILTQIQNNGSTNTIVDSPLGVTLTDAYIGFYGTRNVRNLMLHLTNSNIGSSANVTAVDMANGTYRPNNTLTENTTVSAPTNAQDGQFLIMSFRQDGTGGRTVTWNAIFHGVTLAASGTANQYASVTFINTNAIWLQTAVTPWTA